MHAIRGMNDYFGIAIPAAFMLCLEWWCYQLIIPATMFISVEATGATVIILHIIYTYACFNNALQYTAQALIGYSIGAQDVVQAQRYRKLFVMFGYILAFLATVTFYLFRYPFGRFFTTNERLLQIIVETLKVVAFVEFFSSCQGWMQGIIKGLGMFKQAIVG